MIVVYSQKHTPQSLGMPSVFRMSTPKINVLPSTAIAFNNRQKIVFVEKILFLETAFKSTSLPGNLQHDCLSRNSFLSFQDRSNDQLIVAIVNE